MPIYKDEARKTYYVRYRVCDPVTGKFTHKNKRGFKTKAEAKAFEASITLSEEKETSLTFAEMNSKYVAYKNARETTQQQELKRVQKYMEAFKDKPISDIKKTDLHNWSLWLDKQDLSTVTKNYCISVVCGTYKYANAFYEIPNISMVLKHFKKKQSEIKEMQIWTVDEFNTFIEYEEDIIYRRFFEFLYWTGCRRGEALALQKKDYDPITGTVYICKGVFHYSTQGFKELKNASSIRRIKLDGLLNESIRSLAESLPDDDSFLFGTYAPVSIKTIENHFKRAIKASGVKAIRVHDLRHSFATNAINHGVNIVAVSKYLGHSTIEQTLETYSHLLEKTADEMIGIMTSIHDNNSQQKNVPDQTGKKAIRGNIVGTIHSKTAQSYIKA